MITASADLLAIEEATEARCDPTKALGQALDTLHGIYDEILIDCPAGLNRLSKAALIQCDRFVVPVMPEYLGVESLGNVTRAAERWACQGPRRGSVLGLLINRAEPRTRSGQRQCQAIRERFGSRVFDSMLRASVAIAEAPEAGQSVLQFAPLSKISDTYRRLAMEWMSRTGQMVRHGERLSGRSSLRPPVVSQRINPQGPRGAILPPRA